MLDAPSSARPKAKLLIFDLDGTLIDSRQDLAASVNATLDHLSRQALAPEQIAAYIGDGAEALVQRSLDASGGSNTAMLTRAMCYFLAHYREHKLDRTYVYDGVLTALEAIQVSAPDVAMAVLSNKPVRPARAICEALRLSNYFFAIYGGDSFATKKPNPTGLLCVMADAASRFGRRINPADVVMIGDSEIDVATARSAGSRSIGCAYGFSPGALLEARPEITVHAPTEWLAALQFSAAWPNGIL